MSRIRFNHVFAALLVLSALSAFVIPDRYTAKAQPQVQSLVLPVAQPVRSLAAWMHGKLARPPQADSRGTEAIAAENDRLRQQLAVLTQAFDELRRREADRKKLGDLRELCTPFPVIGADAGGREALLIRGSSFEGLRQGQFALFPGGVAGVIETPPGIAGAQVRLITDAGMRVGAAFVRFETDDNGRPQFRSIDTPPPLIEGMGNGAMRVVTHLTMEEVERSGLRVQDWAVVEDPDWDERLQGCRLGRVARIAPRATDPLYADIRIEPATTLLRLREVMVLTK